MRAYSTQNQVHWECSKFSNACTSIRTNFLFNFFLLWFSSIFQLLSDHFFLLKAFLLLLCVRLYVCRNTYRVMNASERRGSSAADDTAFAREGKMNKNLLESCVGCLFFFDAGVVLISFFIYFKLAPHLPDAVRHKLSNVRVRSVLTVSHTDTQFPCEYHGIKRRTQSQVERQKQRKRKTNRVSRIHKNVVSNCVHCAHCACLSFYGVLRGAKGNPVHFICFHLLLLCLFVFRGSRHLIYFSYYFY